MWNRMIISVLITASGFFGLILTILTIFFEIEKSPKKNITRKTMIIIITCFGIIILGFVNLYYIINNNDVSENQERIETQKNFETFSNNINDNINLSEDELFIKNNYNLIQQLKEEYSDKDTEIIKNYSVELCFFEKAGLLYYDLEKNGNVIILCCEYV